jgi:hypothetical protein
MKKILSTLFCASLFLSATSILHSQIISVDWGGNYVSASQGLGQGTFNTYRFNDNNAADSTVPVTDTRQRVLFGLTNSTSGYFAPGSGYTAPSGKTSNFYMGTALQFTGGAADPNVFRVSDQGIADTIRLRGQDDPVSRFVFVGFAKADFLNGTATGAQSLDATTSMTVNFGTDFGNASAATFRFGVLNAGQWYLSNTSFDNSGTTTLNSSGTATWGLFNPLGTDGSSSLAGTGIKVAPSSFGAQSLNDVQGFGLWGSGGFDLDLAGFSATTIPEPSTYALLGLGLGALFFLRRRRAA